MSLAMAVIMVLENASHHVWHDAAGVLGGEQMLHLLTQPLSAETASGTGVNWRTAEAALYCVRSISRSAMHSVTHAFSM